MSQSLSSKMKGSFGTDLIAGTIVFLIALPLCLGIAQASGAPAFSGIIAGIVGGIVIGFFSKSHLSVSGPAAGLVAIVLGAIDELQAFDIFLCAVVLSGVFQIILGLLKAGTIANFFPMSVIEGMLAGIGLTIIFKQLPDAVGYSAEGSSSLFFENGINWTFFSEILNNVHWGAVVITAICLGILILWEVLPSLKKLKLLPGGLVVVVVGTLLNLLFQQTSGTLHLGNDYLVQLSVPTSAADFISQFTMPNLSGFTNPLVWQTGLVIAVVASIETLLCIEATDKLDPYKRHTPGNSELRAQGIGNIVSGFIGGLPITSVIVRSSANVNAGAKTKVSAIFHGVLLLVCAAFIPTLLNLIPKSALAAILLFVGYKLVKPKHFKLMYQVGPTEFIPYLITAVAVAMPFLGLLKGVAIGMALSIFYLLRANMRIPYFYQRMKSDSNDITTLKLSQEVSFLNKGSIKKTFESFPDGSKVVIDASESIYIDYDVVELIKEFHDVQAPNKDIQVSLVGFKNIYKVPTTEDIDIDKVETDDAQTSAGKHNKLLKELENEE